MERKDVMILRGKLNDKNQAKIEKAKTEPPADARKPAKKPATKPWLGKALPKPIDGEVDEAIAQLVRATRGLTHEQKIEVLVNTAKRVGVSAGQVADRAYQLKVERGEVEFVPFGNGN